MLSNCDKIQLPKVNSNVSTHVYNQFVIATDCRNELKEFLSSRGIETGIQFPLALHKQPVYARMAGTDSFPNSERLADSCLSLPVHAQITTAQAETVAKAVIDFFN
jgi:dTDP-4-amino-4,6-dideoxygalactose transaminase